MEQTLAVLLARTGRKAEARERAARVLDVEPRDPRAEAQLEEWLRGQ